MGLVVGAKIGTTGHPGHVGIAGVQGQEAVVASQRSLMMPVFFGFGGIVDDSKRCLCHMEETWSYRPLHGKCSKMFQGTSEGNLLY